MQGVGGINRPVIGIVVLSMSVPIEDEADSRFLLMMRTYRWLVPT